MTNDFRDLEIWQLGLGLLTRIYKFTSNFPKAEVFGLTNQLRRSSNSIIANIAESQGRYHYLDKIRVLYVARGEVFETRSHLSVANELKYIKETDFRALDSEYENLSRRISAYIKYLESKNKCSQ